MPEHRDPLIRSTVVALVDASPIPPSWEDIADEAWQAQQNRRTLHTGWVVAAAVALAVLLLIAIPTLLLGGGDPAPVEEPTTTIPDTVTTTTVPDTEGIEGIAPVETWSRVGGEVMDPVVGIFTAARTSHGFIAVGFDPGEEDFRQNGVVFVSTDGAEWSRLAEDDPDLLLGAILMYGVSEGGPGYVAVGMGCEDDDAPCPAHPTVWTSTDGTEWDRSAPDNDVFGESGAMLDVVVTSHGIIAVGNLGSESPDGAYLSSPAVWTSANGLVWSRTWVGEAADVSAISPGINALAEGPDGRLIAVGEAQGPDDTLVAGMWRSDDAVSWEQVLDPALVSGNGKHLAVLDVAYGPNGYVAVGTEANADAAIWHSTDGISWTRIETVNQPFGGTESLSAVAATEGGYLITGDHGFTTTTASHIRLWSSPNGIDWDRVLDLGDGYTMTVIATPVVTVLTGAMPSENDFHASVWTGPSFDPLNPEPDPISPAEEAAADAAAAVRIWSEPAGASCEYLAAAGYSYEQVTAYWYRYGQPDDMDSDADGRPCSADFADTLVSIDGFEKVEISVAEDGGSLSGPAMETGVVCTAAATEPTDNEVGDPKALWHGETAFTCDDGSGTFTIGFDMYVNDTATMFEYGTWKIVSGSGDYASAEGIGGVSSGPDENWMWTDTFTGWIALRPGQ